MVRALIAAAAILVTAGSGTARSASLFDPLLRFRVIRTDHFRIYFHNRTEGLAARLAGIAEDAWLKLERPFGVRPPRLTHVVIADQTELPNAYATPLPYDTIVIYPTSPIGAEFDADDWLRLVFTHEFTHIVHLDRSESWARVGRGLFGRHPLAFPNLFLPTWQIEGLATYEESALTGEGRMHAGDFRAVVDEAARHRMMQPLDRVNGGLTDWPGGQAAYAYGSAFHEYLADRYGSDKLGVLAQRTARRVPYTSSRVFRDIFGKSLGELWRDFEAARIASLPPPTNHAAVVQLTHDGFVAAGPRFDHAGDTLRVVYSRRTPHEFPSLEQIVVGDASGRSTRLTTRYFGSTTGIGRDALYFDQLEVTRNVGLYGDLYRLSRDSGRVTRLTTGERLHDPDVSPDGTTIAAVQEDTGRRNLVLVRLKPATALVGVVSSASRAFETLISEPETQFNAPRWSPDGKTIAVERHRLAHDPEIVLVDAVTHAVEVVAATKGVRFVMPAWRRDGRAIVAAAAPGDRVFNIVELPLGEPGVMSQLTNLDGGATWPDVSPDGRTLLFVGYGVDGYDVFTMPYPSDASASAASRSRDEPHDDVPGAAEHERADSAPYSPLPTLKPTFWSPILESGGSGDRIGAFTSGADVLGYHSYTLSATWLTSAPGGVALANRARPEWSAVYFYDRWRATLFAAVSADTDFFAGPATPAGTPATTTRRRRELEAGVTLPFVRARHTHTALATLFRAADDYTAPDRTFSRNRTAVRAGWQSITARTYGYSVSPERGLAAGATMELVRTALGASADASTFTADARGYLPGLRRHHVVAIRGAAGVSTGDAIAGRTFVLGGPGPDLALLDFGSGAISVLRGFESNSFAGSHVALLNVEYRLPLARPQRGAGTWPLFVHTLHATGFADVGQTWTARFDGSARKLSFGAELSANIVFGYFVPLTVTAGIARGHDGSGVYSDATVVYFRAGKSF